ncbi:hypothetical protein HYW46_06530 [Candidatus Daviesbacteria bacterium]|nr:hypothetical protein [Candidatus Daviesbacteria bacterium]
MNKIKSSDTKITIGQLSKLTAEERTKVLEPIVKANAEQFTKIASAIGEASNFAKTISSIASSFRLPMIDMLENIKLPELPQIPDVYSSIDTKGMSFERYDPPVVIKKSKWEIEKEAREAYRTELQIQVLEQQLNLYKGMLAPQYDINTGTITFLGKQIQIPLNTNLEMICRIVLKNLTNMKRKWSWEEIIEENRESTDNFTSRQIYTAVRSINDKVAVETQAKDLLISKPYSTVQVNPKYLAK